MKKAMLLLALMLTISLLAIPAAASDTQSETEPTETTAVLELTEEESIATREAPDIKAAAIYGQVTATAFMDREVLGSVGKLQMESAYKALALVKSLTKAVPDLDTVLTDMSAKVDSSDLAVEQLFHVAVEKDDDPVTLEFEAEMEKGDFVMILRYVSGECQVVDPELVKITSDGNIRAKFKDGLGILAIVTEKTA